MNAQTVRLCSLNDVPMPGMRAFTVAGREVLLVRAADGTVSALGAKCTHKGAPLAEGTLEGNVITCPWHGSTFEAATGKLKSGPQIFGGRLFEKIQRNLPRYSIEVRGADVWLTLP